MPIPLSRRTAALLAKLFSESEARRIHHRLLHEASENIPFHADGTPEKMERIRFSIIALITEDPKKEDYAFHLAKVDWRDLFVAAGFAHSATEHERWFEQVMKNG